MASSSLLNSGVPKSMTYVAQNWSRSKMKRYNAGGTNGITSISGKEDKSFAARVRTPYDAVEVIKSISVQPGVEETKPGLAFRNEEVITQGDCARYCLGIGC